jgi:uncharacterized protein (TIGR03435 family)
MRRPIGKHSSHRASLAFVYVALLLMAASYLCAQEKPAAEEDKASTSAQPVKRDYRFEVASIRPVELTGFKYGDPRLKPHFDPGLYRDEQVGLFNLVGQAFEIKHGYQLETPRWMDAEYFTINAIPAEGATKADLPIMIRHLLEDRFALKYHHETRQMAGYQLVVAKSGPHLTKSGEPAPALKGPAIEVKNGVPQFSKDGGSGQLYSGTTAWWRGRNKTMQSLASDLADRLRVPVMDATGLAGEYDYTLTYTPGEEMYAPGYVPPADGEGASTPLENPLLRDALREQLGLELRPVKNVSIDVVVVDSANKEPTEN